MAAWRPKGRARERILTYGGTGAGKTRGALDIASKALGPNDTMWVLDADNAWDRMMETDGVEYGLGVKEEWRGGARDDSYVDEDGQLVIYHIRGWEQALEAIGQIWKRAGFDDWIVIDSATWLWDDILEWYIEKVHGADLPTFLIEHRMKQVAQEKKATQGQDATLVEWNFINPQWVKNIATPFVNCPAHLYVCAEAKQIRSDGKVSRDVMDLYGEVGLSPATQKRMGHQMQTVLLLEKKRTGDWTARTVKDRGRGDVERDYEGLARGYLWKVAGWRPRKGAGE